MMSMNNVYQTPKLVEKYSALLSQGKTLSPQERRELSSDYMYRYSNYLLTDGEKRGLEPNIQFLTLLAGITTVLVPWTLINMLNMKRNAGIYGPMLFRSGKFSILTLVALDFNNFWRKR